MFKTHSNDFQAQNVPPEPETIIGPSVKVEGNFKGDGNVSIEGEVKGAIKTKKAVRIGEQAQIKANIEAQEVYVAGSVQGNITAKEKLELAATAQVIGDLTTKNLQVASGAKLQGAVKMIDEILSEKLVPPESQVNDKIKIEKKAGKK